VASASSLTRMEILAHVLVERGMPEESAAALSGELLARHPFAARYGVAALANTIRERGLAERTAEETALMLLGFELLSHGARFGRLVDVLERHESRPADALGIALESAGLYRAIAAGRPTEPTERGETVGWAVFLIVVSTALAALWHHTF